MKLSEIKIESLFSDKEGFSDAYDKKQSYVAIIGMAGKVGNADDIETFWDTIYNNRTFNQNIGEYRKQDIKDYLKVRNQENLFQVSKLQKGSLLKDIALFDPSFFNISKQEALYMDPNQRNFLEMAWHALEDAGYAGNIIRNSKTGVFAGFSSEFSESYSDIIRYLSPKAPDVAVTGNLKSVIAGRLSNFLDLKGPSMIVDTACSSGLAAVYTAMRSIQNGDCDVAVTGGFKCEILPIKEDSQSGIGIRELDDIQSKEFTTRTFDQGCSGTFAAEGGFVFILKNYEKAVEDRDRILSVIIGGAINQDGASNGLTAPNQEAQESLIKNAMWDADIEPEHISYIEAHGTATKLGDPIEVKALTRAFKELTDKKQFISIGSVKSNTGHLDNAAGLAGMAKVVMAMKNNILPASLHFLQPNQNISFIDSPLYVNAENAVWTADSRQVTAGISSFGLSGTNCHIFMRSYGKAENVEAQRNYSLFTLSHKNEEGLKELARSYIDFLKKNEVDLQDAAFTAYVGRRHLECRIAVIFQNKEDLCVQLNEYVNNAQNLSSKKVFRGIHKISLHSNEIVDGVKYLTPAKQSELNTLATTLTAQISETNREEILASLANCYIEGGELSAAAITNKKHPYRISLPKYNFDYDRYWVQSLKQENERGKILTKSFQWMKTDAMTILSTVMKRNDYWEMYEHKINNLYVMPGTAFINIIMSAAVNQSEVTYPVKLTNVLFHTPFYMEADEEKELQIIIEQDSGKFRLVSRFEALWSEHATGMLEQCDSVVPERLNIDKIMKELPYNMKFDSQEDSIRGLELGKHWSECEMKGVQDEAGTVYLIEAQLKTMEENFDEYFFHPSLTDMTVNAINNFIRKNTLYLPLSYGEIVLYRKIERHIFVRIYGMKTDKGLNIASFQMELTDVSGNILALIKNYVVKEVKKSDSIKSQKSIYGFENVLEEYQVEIVPKNLQGNILYIYNSSSAKNIEALYETQDLVITGLDINEGDWKEKLKELKGKSWSYLIYDCAYMKPPEDYSSEYLAYNQNNLSNAFNFVKILIREKLVPLNGVLVITYDGKPMNTNEKVEPFQGALLSFFRIAAKEYNRLSIRCIDLDEKTDPFVILRELPQTERSDLIFYRDGMAYVERIKSIAYELNPQKWKDSRHESLDTEGVYVITGGLGELGLELARVLAAMKIQNIVLLVKNDFPQKSEWKQGNWSEVDLRTKSRMKRLIELEKSGAGLEVLSLDLCNYEEVKKTVLYLTDKYKRISGIFHLSAVAGDGYIYTKEEDEFFNVFNSKAVTGLNLHYATRKLNIEHFIAFSSISGVISEAGQSDYTAANAFLDALVCYRRKKQLKGISIQWPSWREIGMAKRMNAVDENDSFSPLGTDEGFGLFKTIFLSENNKYPPVIIASSKNILRKKETENPVSNEHHSKIKLTGISNPDDYDFKIAEIWSKILLLNQVDVHDEFTALGGNSLFISKMLIEFEKTYPNVMDIADLFTYSTIERQAQFIRNYYVKDKNEPTISDRDKKYVEKDIDSVLEMLATGKINVEESYKIFE